MPWPSFHSCQEEPLSVGISGTPRQQGTAGFPDGCLGADVVVLSGSCGVLRRI